MKGLGPSVNWVGQEVGQAARYPFYRRGKLRPRGRASLKTGRAELDASLVATTHPPAQPSLNGRLASCGKAHTLQPERHRSAQTTQPRCLGEQDPFARPPRRDLGQGCCFRREQRVGFFCSAGPNPRTRRRSVLACDSRVSACIHCDGNPPPARARPCLLRSKPLLCSPQGRLPGRDGEGFGAGNLCGCDNARSASGSSLFISCTTCVGGLCARSDLAGGLATPDCHTSFCSLRFCVPGPGQHSRPAL